MTSQLCHHHWEDGWGKHVCLLPAGHDTGAVYQLKHGDVWRTVTINEFVQAERAAGFRNTMGRPDQPATGGFSGYGYVGSVKYGTDHACRCDQRTQP